MALSLIAITAGTAIAKCGPGGMPSYNDISQVVVFQSGCKSTLTPGPPISIGCSRYWAAFSYAGKSVYAQFNLPGSQGTYSVDLPLADIAQLLQDHHFYSLSPAELVPTDVAETSIAVRRCGVTTVVKIYDEQEGQESEALALVAAINGRLGRAQKVRISREPQAAPTVFDPWY